MSASAHKASEGAGMRDLVSEEKATALNSGAVKDQRTQSLSTLAEAASAAGERKSAVAATPSKAKGKGASAASGSTGANCLSGGTQGWKARQKGASSSRNQSPKGFVDKAHADHKATKKLESPDTPRKSLGVLAGSKVADELDDTPEFEGARSAYDKALLARRAYKKAKDARKAASGKAAKGKSANAAKDTSKAKGAKATSRAGAKGAASSAAAPKEAIAAGKAVSATKAGTAKTVTAAVSGAAAPVAGIIAGILAFIGAVLLISQLISALFGFWQNEANKQMMEGLPPYITYEIVEAALQCQEDYGHPAGCTIAQIICESGQGDHMSQLATRDHNLFGIKWASSFAACPEVVGKSSWQTGEEYGGQHVTITAYFTVFKSDVDCIKFRSRVFLQQPHFKNQPYIVEAIANHDSDKMAEGLKAGGWATSSSYVETLKSIMDAYGLRRFDSMSVSDWKDMDAKAQKIVAAAESQLGVPYVWGGSTPGVALDCSGLTQYCYAQAGIAIGHNTEVQAGQLRHVPISEAKPGDILYKTGHVGIYVGGDQYIHEPHSGDVCKRSSGINYFSYALTYRV